jgi:squalene-hopene/tetraprenyl-beta-curcumene cyclase
VRRALEWLAARQNDDGGFGETPLAYEPGGDGRGASTPSQTARVLLALVASGEAGGPVATRAAAWLVAAQDAAGAWHEQAFTATGVPQRGYLRHALDAQHLPLRALGRWRAATRGGAA